MSAPLKKTLLFATLAVLVAGFSHRGATHAAVGKPGLIMQLPVLMSDWQGQHAEAGPAEKAKLPPDTTIEKKVYAPQNGTGAAPLQVTIVLSGNDRTSIHRPEVCLTAQGWNIDASSTSTIALSNGESLSTRVLSISRDAKGKSEELRGTYTYWFVGTDFTTEDHVKRLLYTAGNNLVSQTNPRWAYVSVLSLGRSTASSEKWIAEAVPQFQEVYATASLF